ncbi:hypothetical protein AYO44_15205 [Planctomycetaceae bacterium SCGC AG-212-F19]|nr:hypothetical protein AYO44_15205 [Planctomycetaceae bacterium SCGC AG-212-F19]
MALHFTVLASGSSGNASLVRSNGFGLLLDIGLGPRELAARLKAIGASWADVHAAILTHTHTDHWNDRTLAYLRKMRLPLYCHAEHHEALLAGGRAFAALVADNLVRNYQPETETEFTPGLRCRALPIRHDGGATFGFRLEATAGTFGATAALAYAADLGTWTAELAEAFADVDALALEFNHDVGMQYASGRSPLLIHRVLGDDGHLSNDQAAALLGEILRRSAPGRLRHVIQLHLSRDCNRPALAQQTAQAIIGDVVEITIHTASQHQPGPSLSLPAGSVPAKRRRSSTARVGVNGADHPCLPGMEPTETPANPSSSAG